MRRLWRKDGGGFTTTATVADAALSDLPATSARGHDPRLLTFLGQNMAAAIVKAILENGNMNPPPEIKAGAIE